MQKDIKGEDLHFETFNEITLQDIINKHSRTISKLREEKQKTMYTICIVVDVFYR